MFAALPLLRVTSACSSLPLHYLPASAVDVYNPLPSARTASTSQRAYLSYKVRCKCIGLLVAATTMNRREEGNFEAS